MPLKSVWQEIKIYLNKEMKMTMKLFSRKDKKTNRRDKRPELKVVEGIDLRSRKRELNKILKYRREMLITTEPDNKKSLSVN